MSSLEQAVLRPLGNFPTQLKKHKGRSRSAFGVALLLAIGFMAFPAQAQTEAYSPKPFIVGNDFGGNIMARLRELQILRQSGRPVEIRGRLCYSTCTLFLDLPQTCVSPETTFGFHAPSRGGKHLPPEDFEIVTRIIARHYPAPLERWYMEEGRTRLVRLFRIKGETIIGMGIQAC